jgi:hypothetical protein
MPSAAVTRKITEPMLTPAATVPSPLAALATLGAVLSRSTLVDSRPSARADTPATTARWRTVFTRRRRPR